MRQQRDVHGDRDGQLRGAGIVSTPPSGFAFPVGITTVTNVATDIHGNTNACTFTVTVTDTEMPTITGAAGGDYDQ